MKKRLVIAAVVIIAGIAAFQMFLIAGKNDRNTMLLSGNIEVTEADLGFKYTGRITQLYTDEGHKVLQGEKLAVIDSAEFEGAVAQSRAAMNEARARLGELKAGSRLQDLEQAKAQLSNAEAELIKAGRDHERYVSLYEKGAVSAEQRDAMKKNLDVALSQQKKAAEALSLVREGPRKEELSAAEERLKQASAALKISEERLRETVIVSPISGLILKKHMETGEIASAGMPVFTAGDLATPWIKIYVKEDRLGSIRLGQKADITTDTYPGKKYDGTVTYISSEAEFTPKNVQTQEERVKLVFGVKVRVKNLNDELKPGMPADVRIYLK